MYKYLNQFHMSDELEKILTKLICEKENGDYVCKIVSVTIPEHTEKGYGYTGGVDGLSGADIQFRNEHYGHFYEVEIPTEEYNYIAVMERVAYQYFLKFSFSNEKEVSNALRALSIVFDPYDDEIFNSTMFYEKFPYLEEFFATIDKWRLETERVTIDDNILQQSYEKALKKTMDKVRIK
ncbi:MAG: hypothetical protein HFI86_07415 [Bacilli bacterium]|nr:hypothetical protein [Bacilli bacterium]